MMFERVKSGCDVLTRRCQSAAERSRALSMVSMTRSEHLCGVGGIVSRWMKMEMEMDWKDRGGLPVPPLVVK